MRCYGWLQRCTRVEFSEKFHLSDTELMVGKVSVHFNLVLLRQCDIIFVWDFLFSWSSSRQFVIDVLSLYTISPIVQIYVDILCRQYIKCRHDCRESSPCFRGRLLFGSCHYFLYLSSLWVQVWNAPKISPLATTKFQWNLNESRWIFLDFSKSIECIDRKKEKFYHFNTALFREFFSVFISYYRPKLLCFQRGEG